MKKPVYRFNLTRTLSLQEGIAQIAKALGKKRTSFEILVRKAKNGEMVTAEELTELIDAAL